MYLQLAEGGTRRRGKVAVNSYKRKSTVASHKRNYPLNENGSLDNPYIFIPNSTGGGVYVREDKFDSMPENQWAIFMKNIAPFQPEVQEKSLSEPMFLASRASRKAKRQENKEERKAKKETKQAAKAEKKATRTQNKKDRNNRKNEKSASKAEKRRSGKGFDLEKAKNIAGSLVSKFVPGMDKINGGGAEDEDEDGSYHGPATPFYKNPIFIVSAVALTAGAIYVATKKPSQA